MNYPACPKRATSLKPVKESTSLQPRDAARGAGRCAAAVAVLQDARHVGWTQLKDCKGNPSDVYLPPGILPPVGWYPGDPPIFTEEQEMAKELFPETPPKTMLPNDYDQTTGCTPAGADITSWSCAWPRPGVPGATRENSFNLATPERDQE